jgi:hypothetical protein
LTMLLLGSKACPATTPPQKPIMGKVRSIDTVGFRNFCSGRKRFFIAANNDLFALFGEPVFPSKVTYVLPINGKGVTVSRVTD